MDQDRSAYFMEIALEEARFALEEGEVPVGAVIVKDGQIIAREHNHRELKKDISSHAEIEAIRKAGAKLGTWDLSGCTLYVTLEPCLMCAGAIEQSRISTLVYGADDPKEGSITSKRAIFELCSQNNRLLIYRGIEKEKCSSIINDFFFVKRK